jgi:Spy/CpxP family protein refolding chaperone
MKLMRTLALVAACLFATAAFAQQNPPAQENGEHKHSGQMRSSDEMVQDLTTKLNLTADQQAKIKTILDDSHEQMRATMNDQSLSKEDRRAKMKTMHDSIHTKVRDVLTDEQKPKFDAMVKDMENNMHEKHGQDSDHDHDHK